MILLLDTSSAICKLTFIDGEWCWHDEWQADRDLAKGLLGYLDKKLNDNGRDWAGVAALGVFEGPGSFTGLRIGITVMNTIAYAQNIPIVGGRGEKWQDDIISKLNTGADEKIVLPFCGFPALFPQLICGAFLYDPATQRPVSRLRCAQQSPADLFAAYRCILVLEQLAELRPETPSKVLQAVRRSPFPWQPCAQAGDFKQIVGEPVWDGILDSVPPDAEPALQRMVHCGMTLDVAAIQAEVDAGRENFSPWLSLQGIKDPQALKAQHAIRMAELSPYLGPWDGFLKLVGHPRNVWMEEQFHLGLRRALEQGTTEQDLLLGLASIFEQMAEAQVTVELYQMNSQLSQNTLADHLDALVVDVSGFLVRLAREEAIKRHSLKGLAVLKNMFQTKGRSVPLTAEEYGKVLRTRYCEMVRKAIPVSTF